MVKFAIYTFLGFWMESIYVSIYKKEIYFSGLLKGPFIPLYGFGAIIILGIAPFAHNNFDLFFYSMIACTFIEYLTHFFLQYDAQIQIWDYTVFKQRFSSRICMFYSLIWGILGVLLVNIIDPFITQCLSIFHPTLLNVAAFVYVMYVLYQFYNHHFQH